MTYRLSDVATLVKWSNDKPNKYLLYKIRDTTDYWYVSSQKDYTQLWRYWRSCSATASFIPVATAQLQQLCQPTVMGAGFVWTCYASQHNTLYHKWNTPTTRTRPSSCCQPVSALGSRTEDMANVKVWSQRNNLTLNCTSVATGNEVIGFGSNLHRRETEVPLSLCEILKNAFVRQGLFQGIFRGAQFQKLMYDVMH